MSDPDVSDSRPIACHSPVNSPNLSILLPPFLTSRRLRSRFLLGPIAYLITGACGLVGAAEPPKPAAGPMSFVCTGKGPEGKGWFDSLAPTEAADAWTMEGWINPDRPVGPFTLIGGFGSGINMPGGERFFAVLPTGLESEFALSRGGGTGRV